jgi:tetratricopeptide (TPR) repeat protein
MISNALKIDPHNKEVAKSLRFSKGLCSFNNKRYEAAVQDFTEALLLNQENLELFMLRAKSYIELTLYDDAIIDLMEADKLNNKGKVSSEIKEMRKKIGAAYIPQTNYDFLEVQRNTTEIEIVRSYNSLSLLHKVNLCKASTEAEKRKLEFKYTRVEVAFQIL